MTYALLSGKIKKIEPDVEELKETVAEHGEAIEALQEAEKAVAPAWDSAKAYAKGDYCLYNGSLWKCLAANTGTAPAEGSTWTETDVADVLKIIGKNLSGTITVKAGFFMTTPWVKTVERRGNLVVAAFAGRADNAKLSVTDWITVATIPSGYRPAVKYDLIIPAAQTTTNSIADAVSYIPAEIQILTDGSIQVKNYGTNSGLYTFLIFTVTYTA